MTTFDIHCRQFPRLASFLDTVKIKEPSYFAKPVPAFGVENPKLLIVGLAPGMHGANRTGRPFTGDYAGVLLYETLHQFGYASSPVSVSADDGLVLKDCRITNAVKCLPPDNKPTGEEVNICNQYLAAELAGTDLTPEEKDQGIKYANDLVDSLKVSVENEFDDTIPTELSAIISGSEHRIDAIQQLAKRVITTSDPNDKLYTAGTLYQLLFIKSA